MSLQVISLPGLALLANLCLVTTSAAAQEAEQEPAPAIKSETQASEALAAARVADIAKHYSDNNRYPINNGKSLLLRYPNQHRYTYGDVLMLAPFDLEPGYSTMLKELQNTLPRLGWHFFLLFHSSQGTPISPDDYQKLIEEAIQFSQQQSPNPLFIIASEQAAINLLNLASQRLPPINGAVLILPSDPSEQISYPDGWPIPLLVFSTNRYSPVLTKLRKISPKVFYKPLSDRDLHHGLQPVMSNIIHGWFKKQLQKP
jgi:hypothetical protein